MSDATSGQNTGPTQDQLLAATSPEALAALMAQADGPPQQQGVTAPSQEPAQADAAQTQATGTGGATPGADSERDPAPAGVATKSGKGVLPFSVLQQERQERQHWRGQALDLQTKLDEATAELERLRASGGTQQQQADALADLSDEEIAAAEADFPLVAKIARRLKAQAPAAAPAAAPAPAPTQDDQDDTAAAVHSAIEALPLLSKWQQTGGVVWDRAIELDNQLQADPAFRGKSLSDRFAEVQTRLASELGISVPSPTSPAPAPASTAAPTPQPEPFRPNTLSDLQGGARTQHDPINPDADGMALARRFAAMTPDQLQAAIRRASA
jgi:hypothetical protein